MRDVEIHHALRRPGIVHRLALALVWLTVAASVVVFAEPAPVDLLMMGLIVLLPVIGLVAIRRDLLLYLAGWLVITAAGFYASIIADDFPRSTTHNAITLFLAIGSFAVAAFVARRPARHARLILGAYTFGATLASLLAIVGYFGLIPEATAWFTLHQRASGTFKDPNVFGPFLVPAIVYSLHCWLERPLARLGHGVLILPTLTLAMLLTFSRGAWLALAIAVVTYGYVALVTAVTNRERVKIITLASVGAVAASALIAASLQVDAVARLFDQRAALTQSYDVGPDGRFGGHERAIELILSSPFGIGSREFGGRLHPEDPHNVYLSMLLNTGWLGGIGYSLIIAGTLWLGLARCARRTAMRPLLIVVVASLLGIAVLGFVIDQDHWRHLFLLLGLAWGVMSGDRAIRRERRIVGARFLVPRERPRMAPLRRPARIIGPAWRRVPVTVPGRAATTRSRAKRLRRAGRIFGAAGTC